MTLLVSCSLLESWNRLVMVVTLSLVQNTFKFDDVVGVILSKKMQWKSIGNILTSSNALTVDKNGRTKEREEKSQQIVGSHKGNRRKPDLNLEEKRIVGTVESQDT